MSSLLTPSCFPGVNSCFPYTAATGGTWNEGNLLEGWVRMQGLPPKAFHLRRGGGLSLLQWPPLGPPTFAVLPFHFQPVPSLTGLRSLRPAGREGSAVQFGRVSETSSFLAILHSSSHWAAPLPRPTPFLPQSLTPHPFLQSSGAALHLPSPPSPNPHLWVIPGLRSDTPFSSQGWAVSVPFMETLPKEAGTFPCPLPSPQM